MKKYKTFYEITKGDASIIAKPLPGCLIDDVCQDAHDLHHETGLDVTFEFNGINLSTSGSKTATDLVGEFDVACRRRHDAYWTPERSHEAQKIADQRQNAAQLALRILREERSDRLTDSQLTQLVRAAVEALDKGGPSVTGVVSDALKGLGLREGCGWETLGLSSSMRAALSV